jgi:glycosyltransferase involved in cell wall biosynthesis
MSSRYEGLPTVLIEAMTAGCACVSFDCPNGPRELIEHGKSGMLVPPEDVPALARTLLEVSADSNLRSRLGDAAKDIAQQFTQERVVARWNEVLHGNE